MTLEPLPSRSPEHGVGSPALHAPLIGRADESARLDDLLRPDGPVVVNVTGPRGVGKSALIDAAIESCRDRFGDVQHVEVLGGADEDILDAVRNHIARMPIPLRRRTRVQSRGRSLLVIHRGDRLAPVAASIVEIAAEDGAVQILVESVPELRADGCVGVVVGPLSAASAAEMLRRCAAVVGVALDRDTSTDHHVHRICASLDGNPLAIELAARRLPLISIAALDDLVASPDRALRALTASIGWESRQRPTLLVDPLSSSAPAQVLLDLLSVFVRSFTIEAVEAVSDGLVTPCYDALSELLDLRLVELEPEGDGARYRLSRLVRGFAAERLEASEHARHAHDTHARHYASEARRAAIAAENADEDAARAVLGEDFAECLEALRWLTENDPRSALRLAADLGWEAQRRARGERLMRALASLCAAAPDGDARARRDALIWLVQLESFAPDARDRATAIGGRLSEALALARRLDEPLPLLMALRSQFVALNALLDMQSAVDACTEGIRRASEIGHTRWVGRFEISLASLMGNLRQYEATAQHAKSGLARAIRADDRRTVVFAVLVIHGLPADAVALDEPLPPLESVLQMTREIDDTQRESHVLAALAVEAIDRRDARAAAAWITTRQEGLRRVDLLNGLTVSVMLGVLLAELRGDLSAGARLSGAISSHVEAVLPLAAPKHAHQYRHAVDSLRAALGDAEFDRAAGEGRALDRAGTFAALMAYLQQVTDDAPAPARTPPAGEATPGLTPREIQVLELLARGLRNKEIAADLRITPKSVMHHTVAIYRKLGVRGRAEAATTAARLGLVSLG